MQLSARNQIEAKIIEIVVDGVSASVVMKTVSNIELIGTITKSSVERLKLVEDDKVLAIVKSNNVLISVDKPDGLSARNKIQGKIININDTEVSCEVTVLIGKSKTFTSVITKQASRDLSLVINKKVYVIVKSSDVMIQK